jgi:DNA-binding CsgD family transcriptional regulator
MERVAPLSESVPTPPSRRPSPALIKAAGRLAADAFKLEMDYVAIDFGHAESGTGEFPVRGLLCIEGGGTVSWLSREANRGRRLGAPKVEPAWLDGAMATVPERLRKRVAADLAGTNVASALAVQVRRGEDDLYAVVAADLEIETLHQVYANERSALRKALKRFADAVKADLGQPPRPTHLTEREVEVLTLAAQGKSKDEAAALLRLSPYTVKDHIQRAALKLGVSDKTHAVFLALLLGHVRR